MPGKRRGNRIVWRPFCSGSSSSHTPRVVLCPDSLSPTGLPSTAANAKSRETMSNFTYDTGKDCPSTVALRPAGAKRSILTQSRRFLAVAPKKGSGSTFEHSVLITGKKIRVPRRTGSVQLRSTVPLALNGAARNKTSLPGWLTAQPDRAGIERATRLDRGAERPLPPFRRQGLVAGLLCYRVHRPRALVGTSGGQRRVYQDRRQHPSQNRHNEPLTLKHECHPLHRRRSG